MKIRKSGDLPVKNGVEIFPQTTSNWPQPIIMKPHTPGSALICQESVLLLYYLLLRPFIITIKRRFYFCRKNICENQKPPRILSND